MHLKNKIRITRSEFKQNIGRKRNQNSDDILKNKCLKFFKINPYSYFNLQA